MASILERRRKQRQVWLEVASAYVERLRRQIGPLTAVVYGSVARGDFNLGSDLDLLVVAEALPAHPLARMALLYETVEPPLEPKGYTPTEFRALLAKGRADVSEAQERGIVLVDDLALVGPVR